MRSERMKSRLASRLVRPGAESVEKVEFGDAMPGAARGREVAAV